MSADDPQQRHQPEATAMAFPVSVIMERSAVEGNPWISHAWKALGVTVGPGPTERRDNPILLIENGSTAQFLWHGLRVELFPDEAESYYHNLMVPNPGCYVIVRNRDDGTPAPTLVTVSFDAAQAYQEGDETVFSVPLPPELYRAAEAVVIAHYVPELKKKRKREDWKDQVRA